jgi:hypothetical protein
MNLILFELRRTMAPLLLILFSLPGFLLLAWPNPGDPSPFPALAAPAIWLLISFNFLGIDREQVALLSGMPITLRRAFLTRLLVSLLPVIVLTAIFWSLVGLENFHLGILNETELNTLTPLDWLGLIPAVIGLLSFLQLSNLRPTLSTGEMSLFVLFLFLSPVANRFYLMFSPEYALLLTGLQIAVLTFAGSGEIWRSAYLNAPFRWRFLLLMLSVPLAQGIFYISAGGQWQ